MWRAMGYETYPASSPSVTVVRVKTPEEINKIVNDKDVCDLHIYFKRPEGLRTLKFTEFYTKMDSSYVIPRRFEYANESLDFYYSYFETTMKKSIYI